MTGSLGQLRDGNHYVDDPILNTPPSTKGWPQNTKTARQSLWSTLNWIDFCSKIGLKMDQHGSSAAMLWLHMFPQTCQSMLSSVTFQVIGLMKLRRCLALSPVCDVLHRSARRAAPPQGTPDCTVANEWAQKALRRV